MKQAHLSRLSRLPRFLREGYLRLHADANPRAPRACADCGSRNLLESALGGSFACRFCSALEDLEERAARLDEAEEVEA